jgi:hypothetical protein
MRISRRQLLLGTAASAGAGALAISSLGAWAWQENVIATIVRTHVPHVRIGRADMEAFAKEFLVHRRVPDSLLAAWALLTPLRGLSPQAVEGRLRKLESQVVGLFLMGTNYYQPDRQSETVSFIAYPDPYAGGCANPLARFDFPPVDQA